MSPAPVVPRLSMAQVEGSGTAETKLLKELPPLSVTKRLPVKVCVACGLKP